MYKLVWLDAQGRAELCGVAELVGVPLTVLFYTAVQSLVQVQTLASGNTNLALAVFGCLWESLIVFANDWVHFGV